jgi:hypothetical protein
MDALDKIDEAEYFHGLMVAHKDDTRLLRFHVSAFLSAAASALDFIERESKNTMRGKGSKAGDKWVDSLNTLHPFISSLNEYRNINSHERLATLHRQMTLSTSLTVKPSLAMDVKQQGQADVIIPNTSSPQSSPAPVSPQTVKTVFPKWAGSEDLFDACKLITDELKRIVADGQAQGFLSL